MKKNSPLYVLTFVTLISTVFGAAISLVHYLSLPTLESNEKMVRNRSIARAFNLTVEPPTAENYEKAIADKITKKEIKTSTGSIQIYIRNTTPDDVGFVFKGMGFWDQIQGILVLNPELKNIVRIEILDQTETPGLGARIEEAWFKKQFESFPLKWDQPAKSRIIFGKENVNGNVINAITGATQTSSALERMLNSELERFYQSYKNH